VKPINKQARVILEKLLLMAEKNKGYFKLSNDPTYIPVTIEIVGVNQLSLCHYGELNGDLMRDPEMIFYKQNDDWYPIYFRNDWMGIEEFSCQITNEQFLIENEVWQHDQAEFANTWLMNIQQQQNLVNVR
jgi:hypothetical protein